MEGKSFIVLSTNKKSKDATTSKKTEAIQNQIFWKLLLSLSSLLCRETTLNQRIQNLMVILWAKDCHLQEREDVVRQETLYSLIQQKWQSKNTIDQSWKGNGLKANTLNFQSESRLNSENETEQSMNTQQVGEKWKIATRRSLRERLLREQREKKSNLWWFQNLNIMRWKKNSLKEWLKLFIKRWIWSENENEISTNSENSWKWSKLNS